MAKTIEQIPSADPSSYPAAERLDTPTKPNGVAAAAFLAAGIGAFVLGLMIVTTEAIPAWKNAMFLYMPSAALSGVSTVAVIAYLTALGVLIGRWRARNVDFARIWTASLVLLALGFAGSFPLFYQFFTAH